MAVPDPFILALTGTSLTTGRLSADWRATLLEDLRDQPEAIGPIEIYDLGKGGWTSTDILAAAPIISALKPTHILFEGGAINSCVDTGSGPVLSRSAHIANVVAMINQWKNNIPGVDLTLQTMSGVGVGNTIRPQLANYYADEIATAAAQSIGSLNNYANWPNPIYTSRTFSFDDLHPVWKDAVDSFLYPYVLFWARQKLATKYGLTAPTWVAPPVPPAPVDPLGFYAATVGQVYGGAGTVASASLNTGTGWVKGSTPPGATWTAEITVGSGWASSGGFVCIGDQTFWNATPSYSSSTGNHGEWYLGSNSAYGNPASITFNGANYSTIPTTGDTVALIYNSANNKIRIYLNGVLILTATMAAGGTYFPMVGYWTSAMSGTFRSTPSTYYASYALP